jgi:acetyl esterase/lipase
MSIDTVASEIRVEDEEYLRHRSGPLLARVYRPKDRAPRAALISLHGGRWTRETRLTNAAIDKALARDGALVMALDIRMPPVARYPECIADVNFAIRWLKLQARDAGVPPGRIGGIGTSSGGHQVMLSAMRPYDPRYAAIVLAGGEGVDATLDFVIACWPVLDPLARYRMAKEKGMTDHVAAHDAYWPSEEAQAEGNPQMILDRGESATLPRALLVQGTADAILPADMADNFATAYRKAGGNIELRKYDGQPHTFITREPDAPASRQAIADIKAFVRAVAAP